MFLFLYDIWNGSMILNFVLSGLCQALNYFSCSGLVCDLILKSKDYQNVYLGTIKLWHSLGTFVLPESGCYSCHHENEDAFSTCKNIKFNYSTGREWEERGEPFWYFNFHQRIMELYSCLSILNALTEMNRNDIVLKCRLGKSIWSSGACWKW